MKQDKSTTPVKWFMELPLEERRAISNKYYPEYAEDNTDLEDEEITNIYLSEHPEQAVKDNWEGEKNKDMVNAVGQAVKEVDKSALDLEDDIYGRHPNQDNSKEGFTGGEWRIEKSMYSNRKSLCSGTKVHTVLEDYTDNEEEAEANARLIAQAPAMYRALKDLHWACMMDSDIPTAWWKKHKETVAKAKDILNRIDNK